MKVKFITYYEGRRKPWRLVLRKVDYGYFATLEEAEAAKREVLANENNNGFNAVITPEMLLKAEGLHAQIAKLQKKQEALPKPIVNEWHLKEFGLNPQWLKSYMEPTRKYEHKIGLYQQAIDKRKQKIKDIFADVKAELELKASVLQAERKAKLLQWEQERTKYLTKVDSTLAELEKQLLAIEDLF